jgi:hypothetical protein
LWRHIKKAWYLLDFCDISAAEDEKRRRGGEKISCPPVGLL